MQQVNLKQGMVKKGTHGRRVVRPMRPRYITIHSTQNYTAGADRHALALQRGALRSPKTKTGNRIGYLIWHFTVEDKQAIQHMPTTEQGEHADFNGPGNRLSIGIEMCENRGNSVPATIDRTAKLTAVLMKKYDIPGSLQSSWKSSDVRIKFAYKLKKGQSVQLNTFMHDGYKSYANGDVIRYIKQNTKGFNADFNLVNKRIFGLYNTSFISTGYQRDIFPNISNSSTEFIKSNAYNIMLNQTFLYGEHLLTMNCFYTKVSQDVNTFFYNTKLDLDAGGNFKINKNLNVGMSAVYGYFKDAYTNIGLKSSLSTTISKKMQVDITTDVRKNITLTNPLFDQFVNISCDLKYTIK